MSNMKDYMMWIDDKGIATWDTLLGEMIIPDGVDIYDPDTLDAYQNDDVWHGVDVPGIEIDEDDFIVDDDDADDYDDVSDIRISAIQKDILIGLLSSIVDPQPDQAAINGLDMGTDEMLHLWYLLQEIENPSESQPTAAEHLEDHDYGRQLDIWLNEEGMTADAANHLQNEYLNGELI